MFHIAPIPRLTRLLTLGLILALGLTVIAGSAFAQGDPIVHTVVEGDTLESIAAAYNITVEELLAANEISAEEALVPGTKLNIPAAEMDVTMEEEAAPAGETVTTPVETQPVEPAPVVTVDGSGGGGGTYVVQPGDTVYTIADELGVDPIALIAANFGPDDNPGLIFAGDVLIIPGGTGLMDGQGGGGLTPGVDQTYVVQPRDSLSDIGVAYNVSVQSIAYANGLEPPYVLMPGQTLIIPGDGTPFGVVPPAPGQSGFSGPSAGLADGQGGGDVTGGTGGVDQSYTVQPGDILDFIAQAYDVATLSIAYANDLSAPYVIMPGQVLLIPGDAPPYGTTPPRPGQTAVSGSTGLMDGQGGGGLGEAGIYIVQEGDTLLSISFALNIPLEAFLRANAQLLNEIELTPGRELIIP